MNIIDWKEILEKYPNTSRLMFVFREEQRLLQITDIIEFKKDNLILIKFSLAEYIISNRIDLFLEWLSKETDFNDWDLTVKNEIRHKLIDYLIK